MLLPRGKYVERRKRVFCCCGLLYQKRTTFAFNLTHSCIKSFKCFILYTLGPGGPSEGSSCELTKSSKSAAGMGVRDIFAFVSRIDFIVPISEFAFRSTIYSIWATKLAHADEPLNSPPSLHGAKYIGKMYKSGNLAHGCCRCSKGGVSEFLNDLCFFDLEDCSERLILLFWAMWPLGAFSLLSPNALFYILSGPVAASGIRSHSLALRIPRRFTYFSKRRIDDSPIPWNVGSTEIQVTGKFSL